ncbi:MAG: LUD domain-containing protein, partial [Dehalococcoidia bacterium]
MATRGREKFLLTVRRSLGNPGQAPPVDRERLPRSAAAAEEASTLQAKLRSRAQEQLDTLVQGLERELGLVGGHVSRIGSRRKLEDYLLELVSGRNIKKVARWDTPLLEELEAALTERGAAVAVIGVAPEDPESRSRDRQAVIDAGLGITEVDYAIAETGTLVLLTGEGRSRLVSLLPPVHVALLRPDT